MAYRSRRRTTSRRAPARRSYSTARRRVSTGRRTVRRTTGRARPQQLVIKVVQEPMSAVARPDIFGMKPAPAPQKRKF